MAKINENQEVWEVEPIPIEFPEDAPIEEPVPEKVPVGVE